MVCPSHFGGALFLCRRGGIKKADLSVCFHVILFIGFSEIFYVYYEYGRASGVYFYGIGHIGAA